MKALIFGLLMFAAVGVKAQQLNQNCVSVSISTSSASEVTGNLANPSPGVIAVKVVNTNTANDLSCGKDSTHLYEIVAHNSAAPWNYLWWAVGPNQPWYCKAATASITATVCTFIPYGNYGR